MPLDRPKGIAWELVARALAAGAEEHRYIRPEVATVGAEPADIPSRALDGTLSRSADGIGRPSVE